MFKQIIVETLEQNGHHIEQVDTPLANEMILDGKWLLEMDRDGAFAVTVSSIEKDRGAYSDTHKLVVFSSSQGNDLPAGYDKAIYDKLMEAIDKLKKRAS